MVTESRRDRKAPKADVMVMFDSQVTANSSYGPFPLASFIERISDGRMCNEPFERERHAERGEKWRESRLRASFLFVLDFLHLDAM